MLCLADRVGRCTDLPSRAALRVLPPLTGRRSRLLPAPT